MEFLLDFVYYLYNYYMVCTLLSHSHYVILSCDITWLVILSCDITWLVIVTCDTCDVTLSHTSSLYGKSRKEKKRKEKKRNNNLAILPSHDK